MNTTKNLTKTKSMTRVAIFAALIAIGAFITIPMYPVPITLQTFFVLMAALLLNPKEAFSAVSLYVLIGLIGIPVFAGFTGGPQMIYSPTFGYLIGFIVGAYVVSKIVQNTNDSKKIFLALLLGELIFYIFGIPYMYMILNSINKAPDTVYAILLMGFIPFIPGDLLKLVLAFVISPKIKKLI